MYNNRHIGSMASKHFEFERKSDEHIVRDISDKTSLTITEDKADDLYSELAIPSASRSAHDKQTKLSSFEDSSPSMLLYDYTSLNSDLSSLPNLNSSLPSNPSLPSATVPTDSRTPLHKSESAFTYDQLSSCLDTITSGDFLTSFNSSNLNNSSLLNSVPSLNHNNQSADFVSLTTTVGSSPSIPANFNLSHTSSSLVYEKPNTTPATTTTASAAAVTVVFTDSSKIDTQPADSDYAEKKALDSLATKNVSLWDPHAQVTPPLGSRAIFAGGKGIEADMKKYKHLFDKTPDLNDCLYGRSAYPFCLSNYYEYLTEMEKNQGDLEFWLEINRLLPDVIQKQTVVQNIENTGDKNSDHRSAAVTPVLYNEYNSLKPVAGVTPCRLHRLCRAIFTDTSEHSEKEHNDAINQGIVEDIFHKYISQPHNRGRIFIPQEIRQESESALMAFKKESSSPSSSSPPRDMNTVVSSLSPACNFVYATMKYETFPRFLYECYYHNIRPKSTPIRFACGFFFLVVALCTEFSLLFTSSASRGWSWFCVIPFFLSFYSLLTAIFRVDSFYALAAKSTGFDGNDNTIHNANALRNHRKYALLILLASILLAVFFSLIFFFIPGTRI
ncbi:hypothetical protein AX774_g5177 [Zancudomyces culisetae]|uniref:RGS domain-containing protein n=1 Tax=Zancudomyces culisetae TaxID=1213189 RepID=A0A1R1PK84_ZANCU|nr:hypothetical protein AX774_g5177 [Zancudomyces culisetae]|eukprot:OMH81375.1 hypothetical protein AX774_g5177 [Zancudomyces culisetae]